MKLALVKGQTGAGASDFENVVDGEGNVRINVADSGATEQSNQNGKMSLAADQINANNVSEPGVNKQKYQFEYFVIGGGSGGLSSAIHAAKYGVRVGLCDHVTPTPLGTTWGLGGTCVNVGCIPKKLMHQAALLGESLEVVSHFGWDLSDTAAVEIGHDWNKMVDNIRAHIQSLNWGYRVALQKAGVEYYNAQAQFVDKHTIVLKNKSGEEVERVTSRYFLIATGGRPRYLENVPGANPGEYCITSDDIFSLPQSPGKVVIIGASYIALETAGFLSGLGLDVTILVRSQLLRGFDQQMAEKVGQVLESHGIQILRDCVPTKIELLSDDAASPTKTLLVRGENLKTGDLVEEPCNTVVLAVGRYPSVAQLHLENCGVEVDSSTGKILVNPSDQTSVPHCFAVGDVAFGRPELTPVAIQAGALLAKRLFGKSNALTDYNKVPTTVFTPLEYGAIGLSEEKAVQMYGEVDIEVYHVTSQPLEYVLPSKHKFSCYSKVICVKSLGLRVVGLHYLGPHAGEVIQGFAVAIKMNATKDDLDGTIGIHPTCAEQFTTMTVTKSSGENCIKTGC